MKMRHDRVFQFAKNMAEMSDFERQKIGCVVTYKKNIIGMGFNTNKTHPMQKEYNKLRFEGDNTPHCLHAEMHALMPLRNLDIDWPRTSVFIYRLSRNGKSKSAYSRPCPACMAYMKKLGIKHIYYTTSDSYVHEVLDID